MITLKKLRWNNLFSYAENNEINLSEEPITQLVGLNGHGKSSIPLILEECLFNKNSKGVKKADIVNRNLDTNKYSMALDFSVFNDEYSLAINRSGATQKVTLLKNKEDISSHTATETFKQIESLIGLDFKTFSQIVYQNSSSSLQFLTATDSARKAFLIELLSLDKYVKLFEEIKALHKSSSDNYTKQKSKVDTINSFIERNLKTDLEVKPLKELPEKPSEELSEKLNTINAKKLALEEVNARIEKNNAYKKILDNLDKDLLSDKTEPIDTSRITAPITIARHEMASISNTETKYSKITGLETCPTCYQEINTDTIQNILQTAKSKKDTLQQLVSDLTVQLETANSINKRVSDREKLIADFEKYSNLIDSGLPEQLLDKEELEKEAKETVEVLKKYKEQLKNVEDHNSKAEVHNAKVAAIKEQTEVFEKELGVVLNQLQILEQELGLLEILKKALSTSGLIAYKIENSIKELEELTNEYLAELSDGRFQLEFVLNNDKLKVSIIDSTKSIDISALSAGELARVTTSTLLAIRKLMSSLSKCRINILFLDETIDSLDTFGREKLVEVLLKEEGLNTFLISHSYTHPLIAKVNVIKEEDISRLEFG